MLDAACGTGVDAAVLARRGFRVWATDASPAMIEPARHRFERAGLDIPAARAEWAHLSEALPATAAERFDAVLCIGNSLVHAAGTDAMIRALQGMRGVLKPSGAIAVDSRNWEKLHRAGSHVHVADAPIERDGQRCIALYAWEIPEEWAADHVARLVFVFEKSSTLTSRHHTIRFRPFTHEQLQERLCAAGFDVIDTDFDTASDRYSIVARR